MSWINFDNVCGLSIPDGGLIIARYFERDKANSLVNDSGLFFTTIDILRKENDKYEGHFYEGYLSNFDFTTSGQRQFLHNSFKKNCIPMVSCWTVFDKNNIDNMRARYARTDGSIVCISTVERILDSLDTHEIGSHIVSVGQIRYESAERLAERLAGNQIQRPVFSDASCRHFSYWSTDFLKMDTYRQENEIRFIAFQDSEDALLKSPDGLPIGMTIPFSHDSEPFEEIVCFPGVGDKMKGELCRLSSSPVKDYSGSQL